MNISIKPRLTVLLKERNMTQTQLAELSGIPQGSISRFDRNDRHADTHVFVIAKVLGISVEQLFDVTYQ